MEVKVASSARERITNRKLRGIRTISSAASSGNRKNVSEW